MFFRRPLILFIHLNKTAGTSLRQIIEKNYVPEQRLFIYPGGGCDNLQHCIDSLNELKRLPKGEVKKLEVVFGHMKFAPQMLPKGRKPRYITFVRHPVARMLSVFYHHKTKPGEPLHELFNRPGFNILKFLRSSPEAINSTIHPADNRMTRALCGLDIPAGKVAQAHLELALENLHEHFAQVLLTERFDEGITILADKLNWSYREPLKVNVTANSIKFESEIDPTIIETIEDTNRWDMELYRYVLDNYASLNGLPPRALESIPAPSLRS